MQGFYPNIAPRLPGRYCFHQMYVTYAKLSAKMTMRTTR
jgi:hypothetical protein